MYGEHRCDQFMLVVSWVRDGGVCIVSTFVSMEEA